jgi:hypothetical protein
MTNGNVNFRMLVDDNRGDYLDAIRNDKVLVAKRIVALITKNGGRFLREIFVNSNTWVEVEKSKALEKSCQALREHVKNPERMSDKKVKAKLKHLPSKKAKKPSPSTKQWEIPVVSPTMPFSPRPSLEVPTRFLMQSPPKHRLMIPSPPKHQLMLGSSNGINGLNGQSSRALAKKVKQPPPSAYDAATHDLDEIRQIGAHKSSQRKYTKYRKLTPYVLTNNTSWDEMYNSLKQFHTKFGHSGVPPDWSEDPGLADFAACQRQMYREIKQGYREESAYEEDQLQKLERLNFPMNYEEWHWERRYLELVELLDGRQHILDFPLSPSLTLWVQTQRDHQESALQGLRDPMPEDRYQKLDKIGFWWSAMQYSSRQSYMQGPL